MDERDSGSLTSRSSLELLEGGKGIITNTAY